MQQIETILSLLRKRGLVLAERGVGKSSALVVYACELQKRGESVLIVASFDSSSRISMMLQDKPPAGDKPILLACNLTQFRALYKPGVLVLVDEYFLHPWVQEERWWAAVATPPFNVFFVNHLSPESAHK